MDERITGDGSASASGREAGRADLAQEPAFALGALKFEPSMRQLIANGEADTLEPKVMQVLALLAGRRGEVVSRDELVERCWDSRAVSEDAINRSIAKVRRIAETRGGFSLETIPRVGYRLTETKGAALAASRPKPVLYAGAAALLLLLLAIGAGLWWTISRPGAAEAEPVSLAVLPFRNLSPGDNYFAEGVAEEILTQLARQPGLSVAGRTSSWLFRDSSDPRDVGRRLDVAYILEGSVRRAGQQVRVDVALVGTGDGMRRWSQSFQGSLDDIFAIQRSIGNAVAGNLRHKIVLTAPTAGALSTSGDVYNLYLVARGQLRTREPAKIETAIELLHAAVRLDPDYAPASAALGEAMILAGQARAVIQGPAVPRLQEARRYVERALSLAPDLPEALIALSMVDRSAEMRRRLERAVRIEPTNAELWYALANARATTFDFEGQLEALRRTAAIDPFWVRSTAYPAVAWRIGERREALAFEARMARSHPEPLGRRLAEMRVAVYRRDWSEVYRHSLDADRIRPAQIRALSGPFATDAIYIRVRLGFFDEASRMLSFPWAIDDGPPPMAEVRAAAENPATFWVMNPLKLIVALRLNQHGRGSELLSLYDAAFASPEEMARRHPGGPYGFLEDAPAVVVALRDNGRGEDADRLLSLLAEHVDRSRIRGRVPYDYLELIARIRALQGRREEALRLLEQAVALGWQWDQFGLLPLLSDEPVYRSIRDQPRLRRLDAIIQNSVARERLEAEALRT